MWLLTPKISWITTMAPRAGLSGTASHAGKRCPSSAVTSIQRPMSSSCCVLEQHRAQPAPPFGHELRLRGRLLETLDHRPAPDVVAEGAVAPHDLEQLLE